MGPNGTYLSEDDVLLELSPQRRARVAAERAKAEADFETAVAVLDRQSSDHVQEVEKLLAAYIHHVFFAFSQEVLNQGLPAELIQSKTARFLPLLIEATLFSKHPYGQSDDCDAHQVRFLEWATSVIHNSPSWVQVQEALLQIAERDSIKAAGAQSLPNLPREALIRIEQSEKNAREIYDNDKVPYFPTNAEFSFLEDSIFRAIERILEYIRIFAEEVLDGHLREYLDCAPAQLHTNEGLLQSVARNVWRLTDELWIGYGNVLQFEPTRRRASRGMAIAEGTIHLHPELEPWKCPPSEQWADFINRIEKPDSAMARLNSQYEATVKATIRDRIRSYQRQAASKLQSKAEMSQPASPVVNPHGMEPVSEKTPNEAVPVPARATGVSAGADGEKPGAVPRHPFEGLSAKKQDLGKYFGGLTDRQHQCASLKFEYELSESEIARRLGIHRSTVQEHLEAARKRLDAAQNSERKQKTFAKFRPGRFNDED
jgi:RNA polymerase sigma factor (sigma-70 family)